MAQIMEVKPLSSDDPHCTWPGRHPVEVPPPEWSAPSTRKGERRWLRSGKRRQVLGQDRDERLGNAYRPVSSPGLGRPEKDLSCGPFHKGSPDAHRRGDQIDVAAA